MDIWKKLGIEPTKDKTAIKQAYVRLAHQISPEDDQEEYSQLHDAYRAALDYASERSVYINETLKETQISADDSLDFSAIQSSNLEAPFDMIPVMDQIVIFKKYNQIESYSDVLNHQKEELLGIVRILLDLYVKLNADNHDYESWEVFFEEPIVVLLMENEEFRNMAVHRFQGDDENRIIIASFFDLFDQRKADNEAFRKVEKEKERIVGKKKETLTLFAVAFGLSALIGMMITDAMNCSPAFVISLGCFWGAGCLYCVFAISAISKGDKRELNVGLVFVFAINILSWFLFFIDVFGESRFPYGSLILSVVFTVADVLIMIYHCRNKPRKQRPLRA